MEGLDLKKDTEMIREDNDDDDDDRFLRNTTKVVQKGSI